MKYTIGLITAAFIAAIGLALIAEGFRNNETCTQESSTSSYVEQY